MEFISKAQPTRCIKPALLSKVVDNVIVIGHPLSKWYQCYMKVWIDRIDVEQIICCRWLITFQSCPVQSLLACWPLTAKPRLELAAPALPCLCNFIVGPFQLTGFSNPFHIYCTRLLQSSFHAFWQRLQTLSRIPWLCQPDSVAVASRSELTYLQHHVKLVHHHFLDSLVNRSLPIGVGNGQPT